MAIFVLGKRTKKNRPKNNKKRNVVAILSLTAMVDMFSVLAIFLLQKYKVQDLEFHQEIDLPEAHKVKKLKPSNVIAISDSDIYVNETHVETVLNVSDQADWLVNDLYTLLAQKIKDDLEEAKNSIKMKMLEEASDELTFEEVWKEKESQLTRVTVQGHKKLDFLTLKKVLYTITEAGAAEINFAVVALEDEEVEVPQ